MIDKLIKAAEVVRDLAALGAELADAIAKRDTRRVDEILAGDLQTSVVLKLERARTIRELQARDEEPGVVVKLNRIERRFQRFAKGEDLMRASGGTFDTHKMRVVWNDGHSTVIKADTTIDLLDVERIVTVALGQTGG